MSTSVAVKHPENADMLIVFGDMTVLHVLSPPAHAADSKLQILVVFTDSVFRSLRL